MKLKYRIKRWDFPFATRFWTAQYRILGMWLNINIMGVGRFSKPASVICESFDEAKKRIDKHKDDMERSVSWLNRTSTVVWKSK